MNSRLTEAERRVADVISRHGCRLPVEEITPETAMSQDAKIDGIGLDEFVWDIEEQFGQIAHEVPWGRYSDQRASFRGWGVAVAPFWLIWRLFRWPFDGFWIPPPNGGEERLSVRHLSKVIEQGFWSEPGAEQQ
jgi:acyl carrier protein